MWVVPGWREATPLMRSARYDDFDPRLAAGAWEVAGRATRPPGLTIIWMPASTS
jgi:hypothetical protein